MKEFFAQNKALDKFLQFLFLFWFLTLLVGCIEKYIFRFPGVYWYPFTPRYMQFMDFTIFKERFSYFHEASFFQLVGYPFTYPAPVAIVFHGFFQLGAYSLKVFIVFCFLTFIGAGFAIGRAMIHRGLGKAHTVVLIGLSMLFSYPFIFLVDRANIEIVNWLLVALGVTTYWKRRWYLAAAFFGIAASFKLFPFVFLGLLLSARKYWAVAWGILICAFMTFASIWYIGPTYGIASEGIEKGLAFFKMRFALQVYGIGFDHSAFAVVKELILIFKPYLIRDQSAQVLYYLPWLNGYMIVTAAMGVILFFWKIRTLPRANQILALTVATILLPPVSYDYTLIYLYIAWGVLALVSISGKDVGKVRGLVFGFFCMAFLMAPESFAVVIYGIRIAGQFKAIVLLALFIVSLSCPFKEPASDSDGLRLPQASSNRAEFL